ncbi:MAG: DUF3857 domain-containing protein [Bdellovibrionota bacterium]
MSPTTLRALTVLFYLIFASAAAATERTVEDLGYRVKKYSVDFSLNPEGENVVTYDLQIQIVDESQVDAFKSYPISYSTSVERSEIIAAYTLKADGTKKSVPDSNYQLSVQSAKKAGADPAFSDRTSLTVVFPDLSVGDTTVLTYKIIQKEQYFPGQFSTAVVFSRALVFDDAKISVDAPSSMKLRFHATQLTDAGTFESDGRIKRAWSFTNSKPHDSKRTDTSVWAYDDEPGLIISTFDSYQQVSEAYGSRAAEKAKVTDRIQKLADEITDGKSTPDEQARALYAWVAKNISYAGNCIGVGAVVPRDLDFVLDNKMGDCKDHATLLQALLSAKEIKSTQALVNALSTYTLPDPPLVAAVNHVINYIPSLDVYLDATAALMPYGVLPILLEGKPVLLVNGYQEGRKIPVNPSRDPYRGINTTITIAQDGSATGVVEIVTKGDDAIAIADYFKKLTPNKQAKMLEQMMKSNDYEGELKLKDVKTDDPLKARVQYAFTIRHFIRPGKAGSIEPNPLFAAGPVYNFLERLVSSEDSPLDFACRGLVADETYTYVFPPKVRLLSIPTNVSKKNELIDYASHYSRKGQTVTISRSVHDSTPGPVCKPEVDAAYREIASKLRDEMEAQILFK